MTSYLLLRDNKESGPYSFDELKQKGLKAYDLIWVNGKSAAWRYPSEVDEFKPIAPAVEEQPFDRFFKKPSQTASVAPSQQTMTASAPPPAASNPVQAEPSGIPSSIPGKRIIYVTLPAGRNVPSLKPQPALSQAQSVMATASLSASPVPVATPAAPISSAPVATTPFAAPIPATLPSQAPQPAPIRETASRTAFRAITDPSLEENFAQHPDDMWKSNVEIAPRSQNNVLRRILQPVAAAVVILALVAAGVFIGLSINKDSLGFLKKIGSKEIAQQPVTGHNDHAQPATVPVSNDPKEVNPVSGSPAPSSATPAQSTDQHAQQASTPVIQAAQPANATINPPPDNTVAATKPSEEKPQSSIILPLVVKKKAGTAKEKPLITQKTPGTASVRDSAFTPVPMINRQAVHRSDATAPDKEAVRTNIANLVSVSNNTYNVGTFGGISDLQVTVSNRSIYPLDLVVVEVDYVQANKKIFKTEDMYFRGIGPGAALMQTAPKSPRGIKVQYKITLINSKDLNLSFSAL
ncbi:MAG: hypothetical protein Q8927_07970 [Bacteroidota bacterium]|nr:hypothetical protein [Bacteroidota bacterium]